jgi:hypothetical protein
MCLPPNFENFPQPASNLFQDGEVMTSFKELPASEQLTLKQEAVRIQKLPPGYKLMSEWMEDDETIKRS